jgi:hypothetical protein
MMNKALTIYRIINLLSIDVAVGAMCSALFLGRTLHVNISNISVIVLGLAVWSIYTADHLLDVIRVIKKGLPCSTLRHQFHHQHFKAVKLTWIIVGLLILPLLAFIPQQILFAGIGLAIMVAFYLLLNSFVGFGKEFIIATSYVVGVLLPSTISSELVLTNLVILLCFFITVLFNVLVFSYFDMETDARENKQSFTRNIGVKRMHFLFAVLGIVHLGLSGICIATPQALAAFLLIAMTGVMVGILYFKDTIGVLTSRILGEAIFLLPGFYYLLVSR